MGSLLPGWDSPLSSPKEGILGASSSFTRDEIDKYWFAKHESEEEELKAVAENQEEDQNTNKEAMLSPGAKAYFKKSENYKDWWTRSNMACLNEPEMDRSHYSFVPQHNSFSLPSTQLPESIPGPPIAGKKTENPLSVDI